MQSFPRYHPCWPHPGGPLCSQQPGVKFRQLAPRLTLGSRPGLMNHRYLIYQISMIVPPGSSGGNFDQFPPGGGFSLSPTLPCRFPLAYFPPSSLFEVSCSPNYPQNKPCVKGLTRYVHGFLKVESPAFPHPLTPAPGRGQRGNWGGRRRLCRLLPPQTPFLRKPCKSSLRHSKLQLSIKKLYLLTG